LGECLDVAHQLRPGDTSKRILDPSQNMVSGHSSWCVIIKPRAHPKRGYTDGGAK
jgi:hypothetical protein